MAYLTQTILEDLLGAAKVAALASGSALTKTISLASAETETALQHGGYSGAVPSTVYLADASDCPEAIQLAAIGAWVELTYSVRNDLEIPEGIRPHVAKLESIRNGKMEIPGVTKTVSRAVGGVSFSDSSSTSSTGRPKIFSRSTLTGM